MVIVPNDDQADEYGPAESGCESDDEARVVRGCVSGGQGGHGGRMQESMDRRGTMS